MQAKKLKRETARSNIYRAQLTDLTTHNTRQHNELVKSVTGEEGE
jgi:hypothetical protein